MFAGQELLLVPDQEHVLNHFPLEREINLGIEHKIIPLLLSVKGHLKNRNHSLTLLISPLHGLKSSPEELLQLKNGKIN